VECIPVVLGVGELPTDLFPRDEELELEELELESPVAVLVQ